MSELIAIALPVASMTAKFIPFFDSLKRTALLLPSMNLQLR